MKQGVLDIGVENLPSLENFYDPDGHNQALLEHLQLWSRTLERSALPTYLWGPSGAGKSHLLRALGAYVLANGGKYGYLDANTQLAAEYQSDWQILLLDDTHLYTTAQQQTAFNWFVQAQTDKNWVVATGNVAPHLLPLREDLRSRLGWGHVYKLTTLNEGQRRHVFEEAARQRGIALTPAFLDFIMQRFSRDLGSLMQLLETLDHYSLTTQKPVTTALLRKMLEEWE